MFGPPRPALANRGNATIIASDFDCDYYKANQDGTVNRNSPNQNRAAGMMGKVPRRGKQCRATEIYTSLEKRGETRSVERCGNRGMESRLDRMLSICWFVYLYALSVGSLHDYSIVYAYNPCISIDIPHTSNTMLQRDIS